MTTPGTEIALREHSNGVVSERDVVDGWLETVAQVSKLAGIIAPTEFVPEPYRDNAPAVTAAILTGRELGIGPMTALRHVQMVKGSPTLSAEYKRARVLAAGHEFDILELNTERCRVSGRRRGSDKAPLVITFTMEDARKAGLIRDKGPWQTRPRRMLFARAGSELCDFLFADVVNGLPTAEILADGGDDDSFDGYNEPPADPAAQRTAQRKPRRTPAAQQADTPGRFGEDASPAAPPVSVPAAQSEKATTAAPQGPPLPGEDDDLEAFLNHSATTATPVDAPTVDEHTPGTATQAQLTALWSAFTGLGYTTADKAEARKAVEKLIGRTLDGGTTANLSHHEATAAIDTINRCHTQGDLIALLVATDNTTEE